MTEHSSTSRCAPFVCVLLLALPSLADTEETTSPDTSFAQQVPADVGLFVELHDGDDLLIPLTESETWATLSALVGQPAAAAETATWRQRIRQTIGMDPIDAIRALFAERVAYVGSGARPAQDAVVLCEPTQAPRTLVDNWSARPLPAPTRASVYRLPNHVGVGVQDDLLVFGDVVGSSTFAEVLRVLDEETPQTLAKDETYQRLLSRVPQHPDGVVFARLGAMLPAATQPALSTTQPVRIDSRPELPRFLRGSSNVLLALHRDRHLLHFTAVGDAPGTPIARDPALGDLVARLPERTLLAWGGHVDYASLTQLIHELPERHILRVAYKLHQRAGTTDHLLRAFRTSTCFAVGVVNPEHQAEGVPPIPAAALLIGTRNADRVAQEWGTLLESSIALYKLMSLQVGQVPAGIDAEMRVIDGRPAQYYDLTSLMDNTPTKPLLGELHLSWAVDDDGTLIVTTHVDWLRQILEARHHRARQLTRVLTLTNRPPGEWRETIFVAQPGPIADLGKLWLTYFQQNFPYILRENWWRNFQPGGAYVRIGVQVTQDAEKKQLRVNSVTSGMPADGVLKPGDVLLGCNRRRFASEQPVQEMTRGITQRPNARWLDVIVERDRMVRVRRIPLPFLDPVRLLQRLTSIGQLVQRVVYHDDVPNAQGPIGHLTLELRNHPGPLYSFESPEETKPESES